MNSNRCPLCVFQKIQKSSSNMLYLSAWVAISKEDIFFTAFRVLGVEQAGTDRINSVQARG